MGLRLAGPELRWGRPGKDLLHPAVEKDRRGQRVRS